MHNSFRHGNYDLKYYDKRVPEEDTPIDVPIENQMIYEKIDSFFERIFDENSLNVAKVNIFFQKFNYKSNLQKKKGIKKA